jgi:hypothetical protein
MTSLASIQPSRSHIHVLGQTCPTCDQPIPNEKIEQVRARIEARDKELSEAARAEAVQKFAAEKAQIEAANRQTLSQIGKQHAEALDKVTNEAAAKMASVRDEGKKEGEATAQQRITALEESIRESNASWQERFSVVQSENQNVVASYEKFKEEHENTVNRRVQEARDTLEQDNQDKLNAKDAEYSAEKQKLTLKLADLTRQLEKRTAEELGEGAEIKLFEALKAEFDGDRIERVGRGYSGADILHIAHDHR